METITITKRIKNGVEIFNKKYNDYEKGFYGKKISKKEYLESRNSSKIIYNESLECLSIIERITYEN